MRHQRNTSRWGRRNDMRSSGDSRRRRSSTVSRSSRSSSVSPPRKRPRYPPRKAQSPPRNARRSMAYPVNENVQNGELETSQSHNSNDVDLHEVNSNELKPNDPHVVVIERPPPPPMTIFWRPRVMLPYRPYVHLYRRPPFLPLYFPPFFPRHFPPPP